MREVSYDIGFTRAEGDAPPAAKGPLVVTVTRLEETGKPTSNQVEIGEGALYESTVKIDADGIRFTESGTVRFGEDGKTGSLTFSPTVDGYLVPPADETSGLTPGVATWTVDGGSGFFAGATGTITSVFGVDLNSNRLVDRHLALILLPEEGAA